MALVWSGSPSLQKTRPFVVFRLRSMALVCWGMDGLNNISIAPNRAGTAMGLSNGCGNMAGFQAPLAISAILGKVQDPEEMLRRWKIVFGIPLVFYIVSLATFWFLLVERSKSLIKRYTTTRKTILQKETRTPFVPKFYLIVEIHVHYGYLVAICWLGKCAVGYPRCPRWTKTFSEDNFEL